MPTSAFRTESPVFRFGVFQFHAATLELARDGVRIPLQNQPARLLLLLLTNAGELVTREAIQESLWPDGTNVDFEVGVNRCIRQLRAALGDDSDAPRYVRTIPRIGYCFIAAIASGPVAVPPDLPIATAPAAGTETAQQTGPHPSIAVLPLANLSGNPEDEYFSDGLAEEITNALAQIKGLRVIARTSAFAFKGRNEDIRRIAETLGVNHLLEGSVRRSADRIRVTIQLIDAADGSHRLSKRYERELTDIFALQDEISADVAQELRVHLGIVKRFTKNVAAYEAYLEGRFHWHKYTPAAFERGSQCFERAVALDPAYASAYTGIAQCRLGLVTEADAPALEFLPQAAAAARRAIELDEADAEAHAVLGQVATMLDYDWTAAERSFRRAIELNPVAYVRAAYAMWRLIPQGRPAEAVIECDRVLEEDPLHLVARQTRAAAFMFAREDDKAAEICLRILDIDDRFSKAIQCLSFLRGYQCRFAESIAWAERLVEVLGRTPASLYPLGLAHAVAGHEEEARRLLFELENMTASGRECPSRIGLLYGVLGDPDSAFLWLERAVRCHEPFVLLAKMLPRADGLRSDLRFGKLLGQLNLPL
jgi:TolB-like protein/Tfp pilus assembly protein PilF